MAIWWNIVILCSIIQGLEGEVINIALNKPVAISSNYKGSLPAEGVVDGVITTEEPQVIQTYSGRSSAWWSVDLLTQVENATVEIHFRTDYTYRRNGVQVFTSSKSVNATQRGNLCSTITGKADGTDIQDVVSFMCSGRWRYVLVYTETNNDGDGPVLDFGEVKVWTLPCSDGMYGVNCNQFCNSRNCLNSLSKCDRITGQCTDGCQDGWTGTDCRQPCGSGTYGPNCARLCSSRRCQMKSSCHHMTGTCNGVCQLGWFGTDCAQKCRSGTYGSECSRCGHCDVTCDIIDGHCPGECQDGFTGYRCDVEEESEDLLQKPVIIGLIGVAVGIVLTLVATVALCCYLRRRRRSTTTTNNDSQETTTQTTTHINNNIRTLSTQSSLDDAGYNVIDPSKKEDAPYERVTNNINENI